MLQIMLENVTFKPRGQGHFQKKKKPDTKQKPNEFNKHHVKKAVF